MAVSMTNLEDDAARYAALQADVPCLVASHVLRDYGRTATGTNWAIWNTSGTAAGTNRNTTGQPYAARNAYDGAGHRSTKNNDVVTASDWYYNIAVSAADFDCAIIFGDNLYGVGNQILLQVADDNLFTSNLRTLVSWTDGGTYGIGTGPITSEGRCVSALLKNASTGKAVAVSGADYIRIKLSALATWDPQIREIWLGMRVQLPREPAIPHGDQARTGAHDATQARTGHLARRHRYAGAAEREWAITLATDTERIEWGRLETDSRGLSQSIGLIESPWSGAVGRIMVPTDHSSEPSWIGGPYQRDVRLSLRELPPFLDAVE